MRVCFIGDVHGEMSTYRTLVQKVADCPTIQVGDMGFGFVPVVVPEGENWFIRGNHDSPDLAGAHPKYLGEYGVWNGLFFVSGAYSIDKAMRTPGASWWYDEELSDHQFEKALELYREVKPGVVVSHDAPEKAGKELLKMCHIIGPLEDKYLQSRTAHYLQEMYDEHQPDTWVFGHYHLHVAFQMGKTSFICVGEHRTAFVELPEEEKKE